VRGDVAHERVVEHGGRFGLAAKGASYVVVAVIAIDVALGGGGRPEDRGGALGALADEPFGWALLAFLGAGFAAYAVWRFACALLDRENEGSDAEGIGKRAADFGKGALYAGLCVLTITILAGGDGGGSGKEREATATVLDLPLGRWLVGAVGLGVLGAGIFNAFRAVTAKFRDDLRTGMMREAEDRWYTVFGVFGHLARAVVFVMIGVFLVRAAWQYDPDEAIGLDEALAKLAGEAYGPHLLGAVAFGLMSYGVFCFVQARYREV
jgi:hypothetical protein